MKKLLKYGLLGLLAVFVLVAGAIGYFLATFNPNDYKPQIIQAVKDRQQRTLKLDGDIRLTLFPNIGAKIGNISLSEQNSDKEFAGIESARFSLALMPLLSRQIVVNEVAASGVKLAIVKFKNGSSNMDDLLGKRENAAQTPQQPDAKPAEAVKFDIAAISVEKAELSYRDEAADAEYALKNINLHTGRVATGLPVEIKLEAFIQADKPKLDIATKLQTTLTFDLEKSLYGLKGMDLQVKGSALDISNLTLKATGAASANLATQEFSADKLAVTLGGRRDTDNFNASLNLPALSFTKDKVAVEKLSLNADLDGAMGKIVAALAVKELQGSGKSFKSNAITLDVDVKQAGQAFRLALSTPLAGSIESRQFNLSNLVFAVTATSDKLPGKSVSSEMKGSLQLDAERESVQLNLAGGLLQSQVKAKLAVKGFAPPAIRFDVEVDQFDADPYLPKKKTEAVANAGAESAAEQPFDLSALQKLNLQGSLRMGALKVANVKSSKLRIDVKAVNGEIMVAPLSANLYDGSISGSIAINAAQKLPGFVVKQNLLGVRLDPLLKDALDLDMVQGKGNVAVDLVTQGNTVSALKRGLNGTLAVNLNDGAIRGINLGKLVHGAQNLGQGVQTLKPSPDDKTEFSELKASFRVNKGVARNDDLLVKSQSLKVTGSGDIDIGNSTINYASKTTVAEAVDGKSGSLTVPVQLQGPFADMKFKVDYGAVVADVVKQKVDAKIESKKDELKQQLQEKLKGGLKDLFK